MQILAVIPKSLHKLCLQRSLNPYWKWRKTQALSSPSVPPLCSVSLLLNKALINLHYLQCHLLIYCVYLLISTISMWSYQRRGMADLLLPTKHPCQWGHWLRGQMNKTTLLLISCLVDFFLIVIATFLQLIFWGLCHFSVLYYILVSQACSRLRPMFGIYCGCTVFPCFYSLPLLWVVTVSSDFLLLFSLLFFIIKMCFKFLMILSLHI